MCDIDTEQKIEAAVTDKVQRREAFSAYDITVAVRKQAGARVDNHGEMKKVVHRLFGNGTMSDYQKATVQFQGGNGPALLYHPPGFDPSTYGQQQQQQPASPPAPVAADDEEDEDEENEDEDEDDEADGVVKVPGTCLYVPKTMAETLGIKPCGDAFMSVSPKDKITVAPTNYSGNLTKIHVDRHQNIRVPRTALLKLEGSGKVRVKVNNQEIVISNA
jgi:hypothetical protein